MAAIIGTWKMSYQGVSEALSLMRRGGGAQDAVTRAVMDVEDNPAFVSVGFGALPGRDGRVTCDAAFMDGNRLRMGGVIGVEHVKNPILLARALCGRETNCLLAGRGALDEAIRLGLEMRDMRAEATQRRWREELEKKDGKLAAYEGHDTVCVLALDDAGQMIAGVSTSGLFMKEPGRVGDSPVVGSGFYCDARYGAAAATGMGEEVMRGCLSYEVVSLIRRGADPASACREALDALMDRRRALGEGDTSISLIALTPEGKFGAATTIETFPFTVGDDSGVRLMTVGKDRSEMHVARPEELEGVD